MRSEYSAVTVHHRRSPPTTSRFASGNHSMLAVLSSSSSSSSLSSRHRCILTVALFFSVVSLSCFVFYRASDSIGLRISSSSGLRFVFPSVADDSPLESNEHRLKKVLKHASMPDRTVILTTLNEAWAAPNSVLDLFLESFKIGDGTSELLKHLVIIALDQKAFSRCVVVHAHCFALLTEGVDFSREAYFMTPDYLKMMWRRIDFLRSILEMGYNFVFTDADILWFRNPFPRFYLDADFQIACDHFSGSSYDLGNRPNGGFNFVMSNNRSIEFYKFWYSSRETYPEYHDQDVLNKIKYDSFIDDIELKIRFLSTAYFGGLCEPSKNFSEVCTMHANCCFGLDNKLHDLKIMLEDWKLYTSMLPSSKTLSISSWRAPMNCSLHSLHHNNTSEQNLEERLEEQNLEERLED